MFNDPQGLILIAVSIDLNIDRMKVIKKWKWFKFKKKITIYGSDMPISAFLRKTGAYGMYSYNSRHIWIGVKDLFGICYSKEW